MAAEQIDPLPAPAGRGPVNTRFNASFDERPDEYDDLRASGHMARRRAEYFLGVVDRFPGAVVELGCGTGTLLRQLAAARPDAFLPDLAMSLNNLAAFLSALGRREEALERAAEAERVYRQLAAARPDAFLPDLAMSLNNLAAF
ncbi:MAG TPA: hypothetical protein VHF92_10675, partial [Geodermatophilus sp.]|nr:hypothetical protein [Geodermatophilus sp.]